MRRHYLTIALAAAVALPASTAQAQNGATASLRPYAGYMRFDDFLQGPAGTTLTTEPGTAFGAQGTLGLGRSRFSLYGNAAYARTRAVVGNVPSVFGFQVGDVNLGDAGMLFYDGGVQLDFVDRRDDRARVVPFLQVGAGAVRYSLDNAVAAQFTRTSGTNLAGNVGLGADVRLSPAISLNLLAKDYVADFRDARSERFGVRGGWANHMAFNVGATFGF